MSSWVWLDCPRLPSLLSDLSAPSSLSLPPLPLTSSSPSLSPLPVSAQPQQGGFGNGEACWETVKKPQREPAYSPLPAQAPHFRPKLLTSGPSFWVLSLWQRLRQQCLELPGLTVGPSGQMRGWARARGWGPGIRAGAGLGPWAQWVVDQAMWSKRAGARKAEVTERSGEASLICASSDRGWHISLMPRSTDLTLPC